MGMFDFDGNGHTDSGEQFIGYQIFKDVTSSRGRHRKTDGWTIFIIILIVYGVLSAVCDMIC